MTPDKRQQAGKVLVFPTRVNQGTDISTIVDGEKKLSTFNCEETVLEDGKTVTYVATVTNMNVYGNCSKAEKVSLAKYDASQKTPLWKIEQADWQSFMVWLGKPALLELTGYKRQLEKIADQEDKILPLEIKKLYSSIDAKVMEIYNKPKRV